jgi:serine protease
VSFAARFSGFLPLRTPTMVRTLQDYQPKETTVIRWMCLLILAILLRPSTTAGRTVEVPGDYSSISSALLFALPYDTILVAPGTYCENIEWPYLKPGLKLLSEAGPASTVIDGGGDDTVIGIYAAVDTTTVISGFTIRNGYAAGA